MQVKISPYHEPHYSSFLPPDVAKTKVELARRISANVSHVAFKSLQKNAHNDYYFYHPKITVRVLSSIFARA